MPNDRYPSSLHFKADDSLLEAVEDAAFAATKFSASYTLPGHTGLAECADVTELVAGLVGSARPVSHATMRQVRAADLMKAIKDGGGKAQLKTAEGENLTAMAAGNGIELTDAKGGKSMVTIADVNQANGVIHVVDMILMPKG